MPLSTARRSQNFIVHDVRSSPFGSMLKPVTSQEIVQIDPDVLLISAERVRQSVCKDLKIAPRSGGPIHLYLKSITEPGEEITLVGTAYADGWQYQMRIPDQLEGRKLVRGLVHVALLEFANRGAGPKSAEIPLWLIEGLSEHLVNSVGPELIVRAVGFGSATRSVRQIVGGDTLRKAREVLRASPPLTFAELSRPTAAQLNGDALKVFQSSALLFLTELCRLPQGSAGVVRMLKELPASWNWEIAFLRAFSPRFQQMLAVEKWWSVILTGFAGRDPTQVWRPEICLQKLEGLLLVPADVRMARDVLPVRIQATLQQIVSDWDFPLQRAVLNQIINQLSLLRVNSPPEIVSLIESYRSSLQSYLQKRTEAALGSSNKRVLAMPVNSIVRDAVRQLDDLYRQREVLRRAHAPGTSSS